MSSDAGARRIRLTATGGPEMLRVEPMAVPEPGPGQRVGALVGTGGYATHVLAAAGRAAPLPEGPPAEVLDALVLNYLTARQIHRIARPQPGRTVLVLGAAGGAGSALSQIAQAAGVKVYGTSSPSRRARVEAGGALWVPDAAAVPAPVTATFDPVGGPSLVRSRRATTRSGVVVSYRRLENREVEGKIVLIP